MSLVLVRVAGWMIKKRLWNVIGFDDKGLITASHRYARVVVR